MDGLSEKQNQIMDFPYMGFDALICDGAVRSGKTSIMSLSFSCGQWEITMAALLLFVGNPWGQ